MWTFGDVEVGQRKNSDLQMILVDFRTKLALIGRSVNESRPFCPNWLTSPGGSDLDTGVGSGGDDAGR